MSYLDEIDDRRPLLGPNGLNDGTYLPKQEEEEEEEEDLLTLKQDEHKPLALGETKYGQLTLFPCIDQSSSAQKTDVENS